MSTVPFAFSSIPFAFNLIWFTFGLIRFAFDLIRFAFGSNCFRVSLHGFAFGSKENVNAVVHMDVALITNDIGLLAIAFMLVWNL